MGSTLKFDSDRRELVRERRHARIERKAKRRQDREGKRSQPTPIPVAVGAAEPSAAQRASQERVRNTVDRIVEQALDRHDRRTGTAGAATPGATEHRPASRERPTQIGASSPNTAPCVPRLVSDETRTVNRAVAARGSRRERDLAEFRQRRQEAADAAREEAQARIAYGGEPASVADALAALAHPAAARWASEREQLERALATGRVAQVGAEARRALWAIARDAARTSRRATRDPDLALAACVAHAIIARAPRTALRSAQRARPTPRVRPASQRAFWR